MDKSVLPSLTQTDFDILEECCSADVDRQLVELLPKKLGNLQTLLTQLQPNTSRIVLAAELKISLADTYLPQPILEIILDYVYVEHLATFGALTNQTIAQLHALQSSLNELKDRSAEWCWCDLQEKNTARAGQLCKQIVEQQAEWTSGDFTAR